jgi:RNA polymerase sigma factor (sigma-70 family)
MPFEELKDPNFNGNPIEAEIDAVLNQLPAGEDSQRSAVLRSMILRNIRSGRINRFFGLNRNLRLRDYISTVAGIYDRLADYVQGLQVAESQELWSQLYQKLLSWAFHICLRSMPPHEAGLSAQDFASEAALAIFTAEFPFDVEFEPWAYMFVLHYCRRGIRAQNRKAVIPEASLVSLDEMLDRGGIPDQINSIQQAERRRSVQEAIERLSSPLRREFLRLHYYEGLGFTEIAASLGKRLGAVYKLHFDSLEELRKILIQDGDI